MASISQQKSEAGAFQILVPDTYHKIGNQANYD